MGTCKGNGFYGQTDLKGIAAVLLCTGGGLLSLVNIKSTHPPLLLYDTLVTGMVHSALFLLPAFDAVS